nr:immunoglobulin heavy chain junction region [Macaca mulatta]MOW76546.1 immunoglobulin heavy chain junction region [Macaca mulatta]MOW77043.1 immunoglobulin heavy chain junction region [Macaca mulatta]MOW79660.1 immunoglobulin heavy chain junction region [Macaca mulatta]MOW80598.1 immunoglobulin heavy chain junction region [Macaca mulatta]
CAIPLDFGSDRFDVW